MSYLFKTEATTSGENPLDKLLHSLTQPADGSDTLEVATRKKISCILIDIRERATYINHLLDIQSNTLVFISRTKKHYRYGPVADLPNQIRTPNPFVSN